MPLKLLFPINIGSGRFLIRSFLYSFFLYFFSWPAVYAQTAEIATFNIKPELKAAELYARSKGYGKVDVYLKVYYNANSENFPKSEYVSVFESMVHRRVTVLELHQDSTSIQGSLIPLSCNTRLDNKLIVVFYHSEIDLGLMYAGYDLTWGVCCPDPMIKNMDFTKRQAVALTIQLENPALETINSMPYINEIPVHEICSNTSSAFTLKVTDKDSDEVKFTFSTPNSSVTTDKLKYSYGSSEVPTAELMEMDMEFAGSFLT